MDNQARCIQLGNVLFDEKVVLNEVDNANPAS
jgi:hypothetical protein